MYTNFIPSIDLGPKSIQTRSLVSSWGTYVYQLDTKYQVEAHTWSNSILGIKSGPYREQLDTWYRVGVHTGNSSSWGPYRDQLDTWYWVEVHLGSNSIPSSEVGSIGGATRYQVSSWGPYGDKPDTKYRVGIIAIWGKYVRPYKLGFLTWSQITYASWSPWRWWMLMLCYCVWVLEASYGSLLLVIAVGCCALALSSITLCTLSLSSVTMCIVLHFE